MLNDIQVAFFDLDGTLTNSKQIITDKNIEALKYLKKKNIKIVICTGRWDSYVINYNKSNIIDYIICNNGAEIYDLNKDKVIDGTTLDKNTIIKINEYCTSNNLDLTYNGLLTRYKNNNINDIIYQGVIICNKKEEVNKLIEFSNKINTKITYISSSYYKNIDTNSYTTNINLIKTSKGNAIKILLDYLNIDKKNSICFGDNNNDIEMFLNCGIKVCMKNGIQKLKDIADYITISNDEDGIAYFINTYIK